MADLDEPAELTARDSGRLLAIALAGAAARRVAAESGAGALQVTGQEIGSVGVVVSELLAPMYGTTLAELATRLGAPVAVPLAALSPTGIFPRAADVVVLLSVNGLERRLLDGLHLAASRGAATLVVAPVGSPVAVAAAERRVALSTFDADDPVTAWWAGVAALVTAFAGADATAALADALDEAAAELGPVVATYRNPAKQIALLDGPLLVVAMDDVAALSAPVLAGELGARSTASVRAVDVRYSLVELLQYADEQGSGSVDDLFYDPMIDGANGAAPSRQLVLLSGAIDVAPPEETLRMAERVGTVRSVAFGTDGRWSAVAQVLLAQLSGTYHTLAHD